MVSAPPHFRPPAARVRADGASPIARWRTAAVALLAGLLLSSPLRAQEPATRARIDAYRSDLVELRGRLGIPGLSVAVARNGEVIWSDGIGWADVAERRPATAGTPYRIASITKTMTAAVLVDLARDGALDLDAPLSAVRDDGPGWYRDVTVRQVLSHTSEGSPPGHHFAYSGRYDALARIVEAASGRSLAERMVARLLEPAAMERSYPVSLASSRRADGIREALATAYLPDGEPAPDGLLPDRTYGGNGVVSTVGDLVRWVDALEGGEVVEPDALEELWSATVTPAGDTLSYGLGWWVEETPAVRMVFHGGQWPVYSGLLLHLRDRGLTLAILANHRGLSYPFYGIGTGTALYSSFAAAFLRRFALDDAWEDAPPQLPWDASADALAASVRNRTRSAARLHLGAELFGRGLVARATGNPARADSLHRSVAACCPSALAASDDLGLLFHLGRSEDPGLRRRGQEAGRRRLERMPGDPTTRFHLAISYVRSGDVAWARPLLRGLVDRTGDVPTWMWSWSAYLLAETMADERPARARRLLERVLAEGQDEDGLFEEVRALLDRLEGGG